jgi:hypothetical protein
MRNILEGEVVGLTSLEVKKKKERYGELWKYLKSKDVILL